jgi:nucleoside 2-deoxyribosyltransferase
MTPQDLVARRWNLMLPKHLYIASASDNRTEASAFAKALAEYAYTITSTWHDLPPWDRSKDHAMPRSKQQDTAVTCLREINSAEAVIAIGHPLMRGALWECGYAMGQRKRVIWVGDESASLFATVTEGAGP